MYPVYKIETFTGGVQDYTIEKDALLIACKEIITSAVGSFQIILPTKKGGDYIYTDIALHDKVKIYYGYNSVGATPNFVGYIGTISAPINTKQGYIRVLSGFSQGEILLRRQKKNKFYTGTNASTIVTEWATELGLGAGSIAADTNQPEIEVKTKSYFDLMRFISDYWIDATHQIKKDFYVDASNNLVWGTRPFRSGASVETILEQDILATSVTRNKDAVKNNITVYGFAEKKKPEDDLWCESTDDWVLIDGDQIYAYSGGEQVEDYYIACDPGASYDKTHFKRNIPSTTIRTINIFYLWTKYTSTAFDVNPVVRLHAPDGSNYFEATLKRDLVWQQDVFSLGPDEEYDGEKKPTGVWTKTGSPNWWEIKEIAFYADFQYNNNDFDVDGIYFYPDRWSGTATDAGSIATYGQADMEVTDEKLHSDTACTQRAETLIYQMKEPPIQVELTVAGNTNVLVGDRIPLTISAENITAADFDVIAVEHILTGKPRGFQTIATLINAGDIRQIVETQPVQRLGALERQIRELALKEEELR